MDPTTKGNLLLFFASTLVLVAIWLIALGATGGGVVRVALGVCAAVGAVAVFRAYVVSRR